jgi:type IV secretory pathway TraG/TraD family ATPase VirD4
LGIGILVAASGFGALLRGAGSVAAWLSRLAQPSAGVSAAIPLLAKPTDPAGALGCPGLSPFAYWAVVVVLCLAAGALAVMAWRLLRRGKDPVDPHLIEGVATAGEIRKAASSRALLRRTATLRPSLSGAKPTDVGYLLGSSRGGTVWATVEDSILVIGPPRSGKGLHLVINAIADAPGAVVTTSTRPDNLTGTLKAREAIGPVGVFDPQRLAPGLPVGLRWSPIRGCEDPLVAMTRARGLASATGFGNVEGGDFWEGKTRVAIQALLHAAALDGRETAHLYRWSLNTAAAEDAVRILASSARAADGWGDALESMLQADPRTRDSIWQGVGLAFSALADPRVLEALSPRPTEEFNPEEFLAGRGTLYLLATGAGASNSAALVAALIEDLVEVARHMAARSPGARMDPPLLLALDEIGNLAPLPSLPTLMAEGGGTGITCMPVLQSLAQARQRWGEHEAAAIWDAAIVKVVLGGASNTRDLQDVSGLIGEHDERTDSLTVDAYGGRSAQSSLRRVAIMPPDVLRRLPFGTGVILLRSTRPVITDLRAWTARKDAARMKRERAEVEAMLRAGNAREPQLRARSDS